MKKHLLAVVVITVFALFSIKEIFKPGMMQTHDSLWQVQRATAMFDTLKSGQFPARWAFSQDNGYGIPLFNFVYPGPYYLSAPFMYLGVVNITSIKIVTIFAYLIGAWGMYYLFRKHRFIAVGVSILYLLNPYQFVNIFVRGALGESLVIGLAPWIISSVISLKNRSVKWYDPLFLGFALISHNFLGMLLGAMVLAYGFSLGIYKKTLIYILLSLGLSAFFLIPMITERSNLISESTGNFSYIWSDHFIYPEQLLYSKWDYWYSMPGNVSDGMTFQLGFANLLILAIYLVWYLLRFKIFTAKERLEHGFWLLAATSLVLAMIPQGRFIWELFPILATMQFPWRLLGLMTIVVGIMTGNLLTKRINKHRLSGMFLVIVLVLLALINTRNYHRPIKIFEAEEFRIHNDVFADKTTTSNRTEVVPRWSKTERYQPTNLRLFNKRLGILEGNAEVNSATEKKGDLIFKATAENERAIAVYYRNYYPMWKATIDGQKLEIMPDQDGNIQIPLTQGVHEYRIYLTSTNMMQLGNTISLISVAIVAILAIFKRKNEK